MALGMVTMIRFGAANLCCAMGQSICVLAHIHLAPLPGGEKAVKEPWRQALWYLRNYYGEELPNIYKTWLTTIA